MGQLAKPEHQMHEFGLLKKQTKKNIYIYIYAWVWLCEFDMGFTRIYMGDGTIRDEV